MTPEDLARKLAIKVEYMITQYHPRPECPGKQVKHKEEVAEIKRLIAHQLAPQNNGLNICLDVTVK